MTAQQPTWSAQFHAFAQKLLSTARTPGAAVGLAESGATCFFGGFGHRDREAGLPVTDETLFGLASIAKSFTCVAILQLQEAGRLAVTDPVIRHIPEFRTPDPAATGQITLHHLMTHTAGFPYLPFLLRGQAPFILADPTLPPDAPLRQKAAGVAPITTTDEHLQALADAPYRMIGRPGERFNYANDGYALLGFIIERVSGKPYAQYIREHIFRPAGMVRSVAHPSELADRTDVAVLYEGRLAAIERADFWRPAPTFAGAGTSLASSVTEILRYLDLFRTGGRIGTARILAPESVQALITPHVQLPTGDWYGYGLRVTPAGPETVIGHAGGTKGVASAFYVMPGRGLAAVMLSNLNPGPNRPLARGLINCALGLAPNAAAESYAQYPLDPARLAAYVGTYANGDERWVISIDEGRLVAQVAGRRYGCRPVGEHRFTIGGVGNEHPLAFLVNASGVAEALFYGTAYVPRE